MFKKYAFKRMKLRKGIHIINKLERVQNRLKSKMIIPSSLSYTLEVGAYTWKFLLLCITLMAWANWRVSTVLNSLWGSSVNLRVGKISNDDSRRMWLPWICKAFLCEGNNIYNPFYLRSSRKTHLRDLGSNMEL